MKRLFLALELPDAIKDALLGFQPQAGKGLRPLQREGLHVTLCFIGTAEVEAVDQAIGHLKAAPFPIHICGLGHRRATRGGVLWAVVEPAAALMRLQAALSAALRRAGLPRDHKPFHPHVTLARCKPGVSRRRIEYCLQAGEALAIGPVRIREFVLFSSDTRPEGAVYRVERRYPLVTGIGRDRP